MLSFGSSLSNTIDDGDDDDDDLAGFLLSMATSRAALTGSWVLCFTTDGTAPASNPLLSSICLIYDMQENTSVHTDTAGAGQEGVEEEDIVRGGGSQRYQQ